MNSVRRALTILNEYRRSLWDFLNTAGTSITSEERQERVLLLGQTLRYFLPLAIPIAIINSVVAASQGNFVYGLLVNIPGLLLAVVIERLTRTSHYRLLVWIPPVLGIPLIYLLALQSGAPYLYLFVLALFPMYGAVLLYIRANIFLAILGMGALIGFYTLFPHTMPLATFLQWLGMFLMVETLLVFFAAFMLRLETREERMNQQQQRLNAMRDFIRNISHDFRTPLTVIQSSAYLLWRHTDPQKRQHQARQIDRMVDRMEEMLNNTVLLARLQSMTTIKREPVDLRELFKVLEPLYRKAAEHQGIHFQIEIPQSFPEVFGDAELLLAALRHILDNALRYTEADGQVWISAQRTGTGVAITVADTGMGISANQLMYIFEPMYRTDSARAMETGGSGVGLAIAQLAVELHGGHIHVTSEESVGSQFTINLPVPSEMPEPDGCLPGLCK